MTRKTSHSPLRGLSRRNSAPYGSKEFVTRKPLRVFCHGDWESIGKSATCVKLIRRTQKVFLPPVNVFFTFRNVSAPLVNVRTRLVNVPGDPVNVSTSPVNVPPGRVSDSAPPVNVRRSLRIVPPSRVNVPQRGRSVSLPAVSSSPPRGNGSPCAGNEKFSRANDFCFAAGDRFPHKNLILIGSGVKTEMQQPSSHHHGIPSNHSESRRGNRRRH